jgi:hypothetical protein
VPPGWVFRVFRMVENRHAYNLALYRPIVIAPRRTLTPRRPVANTFAVDNMSLTDLPFESHRRRQTNRHRAFLGITEDHLSL